MRKHDLEASLIRLTYCVRALKVGRLPTSAAPTAGPLEEMLVSVVPCFGKR